LRRVAERLHVTFLGYSELFVEQFARRKNMSMHKAQHCASGALSRGSRRHDVTK
jgi:hypothetical protein